MNNSNVSVYGSDSTNIDNDDRQDANDEVKNPGLQKPQDQTSKVTSDSKTLRFSKQSVPVLEATTESVTSSVINVNALANTEPDSTSKTNTPSLKDTSVTASNRVTKKRSLKNLPNRISSIFTNLPNDIELSDDSASDTETVNDTSFLGGIPENSSLNQAGAVPPPELAMYRETSVKSSPVKARQVRSPTAGTDASPTMNSFNTLKQYNMKKKSSNLSASLIDNARSIINQNFHGNISSASSFVEKVTKKKRKTRPSQNPLKSGGIPKKYWMNDAFVSECLNCFKPFTAFRRKHHCRFCGQIFCSRCTLFISYQEHKEQRKTGVINPDKRSYKDKLRVCRPCYSDVIVYLSDSDSSSSESEQEVEDDAVSFETLDKFKDDNLPQHPFVKSRSRSLSTSRRDFPFEGNKSFLKPALHDDKTTVKSPLSLAIPSARKGDLLEVQYSKSNVNSSFSRSTSQEPSGASWLKNYPHLRRSKTQQNTGLSRSNSFDNSSSLHGFISGKTDVSKKGKSMIFGDTNGDDPDDEDDEFESENEDEQVMSLYTSLNHSGFNGNANSSTISPRAPITRPLANVSANAVPTLGEFPTMLVNEKLYPKNMSSGLRSSPAGAVFPVFIPNNTKTDIDISADGGSVPRSVLEENPKSNLRSHERAHASLLRMRSRRRAKTARNLSLLTQNPTRLPQLEFSDLRDSSSPISTPTSPTPGSGPSGAYFKDLITNEGFSPLDKSPSDPQTRHQISYGSLNNFDADDSDSITRGLSGKASREGLFDEIERQLDSVYLELFKKILDQCLKDCDIKDDTQRWSNALTMSINFVNGLKLTDTLDIKQYVKIKKIPGGRIEDTQMINGLFMTKNIDSKKMSSRLSNPKIALLMFPIEYLKQKEQFISLRIVQSQQDVYISNLVSRLISLEPDIIVVGDTVCQLAKDFLEDANITVISNTKPQVIERISRYTRADIFQSVNDLFFKKGTLGTCQKFEIKKHLHGNVLKTFACFTGTDTELGFTITLRGGDEETLNSIKYATENLLSTQINAKFEKSYFEDSKLVYLEDLPNESVSSLSSKLNQIKSEAEIENMGIEIIPDEKEVFGYIAMFINRHISTSPAAKFSLPTPLVNAVEAFFVFHNFNERNKLLKSNESLDDVEMSLIEELKLNIGLENMPNKAQDLLKFVKHAAEVKSKILLNQFQSRARTWANYLKLPSYQLYPIFHRNIHLLYSSVSKKFNTPCSGPNIIVVDFYTDNDKFLGLQLDQMFSESLTDCDECGEPMIDHYRNYVHGTGKLDMVVEKYEALSAEHKNFPNQRTMWSVCKQCNYKTPVVLMSDDTYYFSIGKYFEIAFWGRNVTLNNQGECRHDFFKEHIRYFGFNDMAIKVEYFPIDTYEVVVPKKQTEYDTSVEINLKVEAFDTIRTKSANFFDSISKRLNRVKVDTFDKAEDGAKVIEQMKERLDQQRSILEEDLLNIYNSTPSTYYLPMNSILRELQELGVAWDADFNDFETQFLPSENEITRITQFHLRNFLIDKYNIDNAKEVEMNDMSKSVDSVGSEKEGLSSKSDEKTVKQQDKDSELVQNLNESPRKEIGKLIPRALEGPGSNVVDKVNKIEQKLEHERIQNTGSRVSSGTGSMTDERKSGFSPPKKASSKLLGRKSSDLSISSVNSQLGVNSNKPVTKVSQLTNFFDQMSFDQISMEFKKQREQELRKNLNKFRALPIVASKPIVEMYNKIEDVVNADELEVEKANRRLPRRLTSDSLIGKRPDESTAPDLTRARPSDVNDSKDRDKQGEKLKEKDAKAIENLKSKEKDKLLDIPQPERVSLLKSLTNFWADRSASLWDPLDYPLDSTEHTFADSDIIVREDEPSSLVAFCLSTNDYKQKIKSLAQEPDDDIKLDSEVNNKKFNSFAKIEKKFKNRFDNSKKPSELENILTKNKSTHLKYQFADGSTTLSCKIFYSEQFEALRKACGKEDRFLQSLSRCIKWNSSGGKSKSNFLKTLDNRYIVKELSKSELESFVPIAPFYFKYIGQSMFNTLTTALAKIFGIYQIQIKNIITGKTFRMEFLIMENLFYNNKTTRIFDLKGSMRNRHVTQTGKEDEVLLDENMIEYIYESPLFVKEHSKKLLRGSLFNDSSFLSAMDVMDYSLIIGIDDQTKKLYIGIIDWLRTFTWDKKVENWVKGNNLIGGNKGKDPTIITPKQYRIRFREAMERYILEVPDIWYEGKN
ncbi:hypothetical protein CANTEDRAFT_119090 [Yamadazyma tenuis ATCC 10573]|uniref:1-phosphatidylinositol-3-phosphate 5-kinase n=2 Tax=Candida tenuis TaxID=2315449 RepID=G3AZ67_CANTC|nr:uncharacterized protein CANTEDRAFT_119090 [Yamadazyma tenuis ATCC 10573]EGV66020.1 hypothetical protein CANTEDRAFT_119090 [Yamadazyma tenuis ATCC 10573]